MFEDGSDIQKSGPKADVEDLTWVKLKAEEQGISKSDVPRPGNVQNGGSRIERRLLWH
jgi:hypothetical protein